MLWAGQSPPRFFHANSVILLIFFAFSHLKSLNNTKGIDNMYGLSLQKSCTPFLGGSPRRFLLGAAVFVAGTGHRTPKLGRAQVPRGRAGAVQALRERCHPHKAPFVLLLPTASGRRR